MRIEFVASLPPIQSAAQFSGEDGGGARVKIDIPGTHLLEAVKLLAFKGHALKFIVEPLE